MYIWYLYFFMNLLFIFIAFEISCLILRTPPEATELSSLLLLWFVLLNCDLCCNRKESFLGRPATVLLWESSTSFVSYYFCLFFDDKKNYVLSLYFNIYVKLILFHKIIRFIGIWLLWYWKVLWQQNPFIVHNEDYLMIWMYSTYNNFW